MGRASGWEGWGPREGLHVSFSDSILGEGAHKERAHMISFEEGQGWGGGHRSEKYPPKARNGVGEGTELEELDVQRAEGPFKEVRKGCLQLEGEDVWEEK